MNKEELYAMWEDGIPANNASGGSIAGLPPDEPPVFKKKKKLDGRYKDVKKFVSRLLKRRQKREDKLRRKTTLEEELIALQESGGKVIDQLKKISAAGGTGTVVFDDGSKQPVNPAEAGKMVTLYQDLNASNRVKMIRSINTSTQGYEQVKAFAQSRT